MHQYQLKLAVLQPSQQLQLRPQTKIATVVSELSEDKTRQGVKVEGG